MRSLSIYLVLISCLLTGCSFERGLFTRVFTAKADSVTHGQKQAAAHTLKQGLPDTRGTVFVLDNIGKLKIDGPVTFQTGEGNNSSTTRTDNTGRGASEGANGGNSQPTTTNSIPAWALVLVLLIGAGLGVFVVVKWQQRKARAREPESG